jgi:hypothetical protein
MNPFVFTHDTPPEILRMPIEQEAATEVRALFLDLGRKFFNGVTEFIDFDPGYQLTDDECFQIAEFQVPDELLVVCTAPNTAEDLKVGDLTDEKGPRIKAIIGYDFSGGKKELMFQTFDARRMFSPGKGVFRFDKGVFHELKSPVISIEQGLVGVWRDGTLFFKKLGSIRRVFDFEIYEMQATEEQMTEFASHSKIKCADSQAFAKGANRWSRGKIARILKNKVLDDSTLMHLQTAAHTVEFVLPVDGGKIVLPESGLELKRLLQFLDDDMYRGPVSDRQFLSSGKRELN